MNIEQLTDFGVSEEIAEKILESFEQETGVLQKENEKLRAKFDEYNEQLNELDKYKTDNESLTKKFTEYKERHRDEVSKFKQEMSEFRRDLAIGYAMKTLEDVPHDSELVLSLIDKGAISVDDDGNLSGFNEQIQNLIENKPFLFKHVELASEIEDDLDETDDVLDETEDDISVSYDEDIKGVTPDVSDYAVDYNTEDVFTSIGSRLARTTIERAGK